MNSSHDRTVSVASGPESTRSPRITDAPLITIESTDLDPAPETANEVSSLAPHPLSLLHPAMVGLRPPSNRAGTHLHVPASRNDNVTSNSLQIPSSNRHIRSNSASSIGSDMSRWSGWTPTPATEPSSEFGDISIDMRALLSAHEESDSAQTDNPFAFTESQVGKQLYDPKNLEVLRAMEGLEGLTMGLRTDVKRGLSPDEDILDGCVTLEDMWSAFESPWRHRDVTGPNIVCHDIESVGTENWAERDAGLIANIGASRESKSQQRPKLFQDRRRIFGENKIAVRPMKNIFQLMWIALHDKILILLIVAAVTSLALGLYQTFRPGSTSKLEWIEGVAILTAVAIVTVAQSINDYQKERQFAKLNQKKEDREVKIVRGGTTVLINIYDILVGDILLLEAGDIVPVDGILAEGHDVRCDESSVTGESDTLNKIPADLALENSDAGDTKNCDPFILSGTKVLEGVGKCVVTAVGKNSCYGRMMLSFQDEPEDTPLQVRLNRIADMIAKWGGGIALLLFVILLIKFVLRLPGSNLSPSQIGEHFMQILIVSVSIVVVAVPEGLPLAVTLSLAYATIRMIEDNNLVRVLKACETVGNATTICSDKTGTLTENKMTVVAGTIGTVGRFEAPSIALELDMDVEQNNGIRHRDTNIQTFFRELPGQLMTLLRDSIVLNSTAFEITEDDGNKFFIGSKTEIALLNMAKSYLGLVDVAAERENAIPREVQVFPFSSERKCMGIVVEMNVNGHRVQRLFVKGASEVLLRHTSHVIDLSSHDKLSTRNLSDDERQVIGDAIEEYASLSLRTIALVYRDFPAGRWPPNAGVSRGGRTQANFEHVFKDMVFIGVVGIKDPLRFGVIEAVSACRKAGVTVRMVTGDNISTAKAIATECGIYTDGIIMEGPEFRNLARPEMNEVIPRLQVLARSSPEDKRMLVKRLKRLGEIVAVTGDGTNDGPALHAADVGFSMGIAGTEVAKASSSIILMDDNFASIVKAIAWGRCVNDAVKKFLQFQLTVSVTAVGFAFVSSVMSTTESSALTAVQLLWVNLIQDTLAALALATDPPTLDLLNRQPESKRSSLISFNMWKMIFGQSVVQLSVIFFLNFAGTKVFSDWSDSTMNTTIFNTFVWLQIFNEINCRRLDNKINVFSGIQRNMFFIVIMVIMIACQTFIIFVGGAAFSVTRLNGYQWLISIALGFVTIPAGAIVRLIPNDIFKRLIPKRILEWQTHSDKRQIEDWDEALEVIHDDLVFFKKLRGERRLRTIGTYGPTIERLVPQTESPTRQPTLISMSTETNSPFESSRLSPSQLYSVNTASTLVPGLVALSMALAPVSHADELSSEVTRREVITGDSVRGTTLSAA